MKENTCCFTGHRTIAANELEKVKLDVKNLVEQLVSENITDFICGGALGFDTLAACAVIRMRRENPKVRLILALPCQSQDKYFSPKDKQIYKKIIDESDEVIYTERVYSAGCMHKRNRFMVDNSSRIITYVRKTSGGSFYTREYAIENNLTVYDV